MKRYRHIRYYRALRKQIRSKKQYKSTSKLRQILMDNEQLARLFGLLSSKIPLLIRKVELPSFKWPETVKVVVSDSKRNNQSLGTIPYQQEQEQQTGVMLTQISSHEFLNYQGKLDLSIAQMKLQQDEVQIPSFVKEYFATKNCGIESSTIEAINLWCYKGDRLTTWHYDGHDNFLFMLQGTKKIRLLPPNQPSMPAKSVFNVNNNHYYTKDKPFQLDEMCFKCSLKPGQCLFIPRGWWHEVRSFGRPSIAINIWGNSFSKHINEMEQQRMLRHLILTFSDRLCSSMKGWEELPERIRQRYRATFFQIYIDSSTKTHN